MIGIIIVNQDIGHNAYKIKRFKEEFSKLNVTLMTFVNDGTLAKIVDNKIKINLPKVDFIIYLDKDAYLAKELESVGYRLFNKGDFISLCDDKNLTNIECAKYGIRMPKTICAPLFYSDKLTKSNLTFLKHVGDELGFPLVFKKVYSSLGKGVSLVKNNKELIKAYKENCREKIQFQEYIKDSYGISIRILIIDKKVVGGFIRCNPNDFRSNYGNGASSRKLEETEKYYSFAQNIAEKLKIEYAGIDLLIDDMGEPILCEINSNAFFEEFEKVTKINVAQKFAKMVVEKLSNE